MSEKKLMEVLSEKPKTVGALFMRYLANPSIRRCAGTLVNERAATAQFLAFCGDVELILVTPERIDAWKILLSSKYMSNTWRLRMSIVKAAFQYGVSIGAMNNNPCENVRLPGPTFAGRVVSDKILKKFLNALPPIIRRKLKLMLYTGMRHKEAALLDWSEVHGNTIVLVSDRTKNRKERIIYLTARAKRLLGARGTGRVFHVSMAHTSRIVTRTYKRLGFGRIRIHDMRHIAASRHYERNHDDRTLMCAFGWASAESAKPYHHVTDMQVKKSMARVTYAI